MSEKTEKRLLIILRTLLKANRPLGSSKLMESLVAMGQDISERTVRHYLLELDKRGLTQNLGKKGRIITEQGARELNSARIIDKVGFLSAKIDQLTYRMSFDLYKKSGTVVINMSLLTPEQVKTLAPLICRVYEAGYSMGDLMGLFMPGENIGEITVPHNMIGLGTVCSITINGVLLTHGIPARSRFGGLLELRNKEPGRFVEIISYEGSSIDPLEVFIQLSHKLHDVRLGGFLMIGWPGQPLLEIPVNEGRVGAIVIGGLNPIAILEEIDKKINSWALAGLVEYEKLFPYHELMEKIQALI